MTPESPTTDLRVEPPLVDGAARHRIATALDETLFVEAGAGSGKTASLVTRVVSLIASGVPVTAIAAITFSEAAAAELRTRVRQTLEKAERGEPIRGVEASDELAALAADALDSLDEATMCTLHAFAQRLLLAAPVEAGLPPVVDVHDDISSALAFEKRWRRFEQALLDDDALATLMRTAMVLGVDSTALQSIAGMMDQNWDLVVEAADAGDIDRARRIDVDPTTLPVHDIVDAWGDVLALAEECTRSDDTLLAEIEKNVLPWYTGLLAVRDDPYATLEHLRTPPKVKRKRGAKGNWPDDGKDRVYAAVDAALEAQMTAVGVMVDDVLTRIGAEIAAHTLTAAEARRRSGRLEFHDLLVLARRVLRSNESVRRQFHDRYRTLLIDEFQDTDPLQIELAVRIAADPEHDTSAPWKDVSVAPGRLFFVGDPKQSIYRFRRADIDLFLQTADLHLDGVTTLSVNFRTTKPVLDVVNAVFDRLITHTTEDIPGTGTNRIAQPDYVPLADHRVAPPEDPGPPVLFLGDGQPHDTAAEARLAEATDVAGALRRAREESWLVDESEGARPARWSDMAVLLPSRTSLPHLRAALEADEIPYRLESGTLVFGTTEITDLLSVLRAIDDPGDHIAIVGALRSPAYGCGDDEIYAWVRDHGPVAYLGPDSDDHTDGEMGGRVFGALADLRERHRRAPFQTVSEIVDSVIEDRRLMELSLAGGRHRDSWRLYRIVVEHARAFADHETGGLREFLAWAALQRDDKVRATSPVLPEADVDAVRILTIHGAKGLEFGICAVSGLSGQDPNTAFGATVQFHPAGGFDVRIRKGMETTRFQEVRTLEETMDVHERIRLLYVALTRARDHLIVSIHHTKRGIERSHGGRLAATIAQIEAATEEALAPRWTLSSADDAQLQLDLGAAVLGAAASTDVDAAEISESDLLAAAGVPIPIADAYDVELWQASRASWRQRREATMASRRTTVSATALAGTMTSATDDDSPEHVDAESEPWRRGRAGTSVGSAVHAVLQHSDLRDVTGADIAGLSRWQATVEGIPGSAAEIEAKARAALASPLVRRAVASGRWRREVHVGVPIETTRGTRLFEGFVDLLFDEGDGLVVVDYKTDAITGGKSVAEALERYTPQAAAYAVALEAALGRPVASAHFLFLRDAEALDVPVTDLAAATAAVRAALADPV